MVRKLSLFGTAFAVVALALAAGGAASRERTMASGGSTLIRFAVPPITLGNDRTAVKLDLGRKRARLAALVTKPATVLLLSLKDVVTPRPPGAVWQVFLGAPRGARLTAASKFFVGNVAIYGDGICDPTAQTKCRPATVALLATKALRAALQRPAAPLALVFVPSGPLINGHPSHVTVNAKVRIGSISLVLSR